MFKKIIKLHRLIFVLVLGLGFNYAHAQQDKKSNLISLEYLQDSSDTANVFVDLSVAITDDTGVNAGWGNTRSDSNNDDLNLGYFSVGVTHKFTEGFSTGIDYYQYGEDNEIEIDSLAATLRWNIQDWSLSLKPQYKKYRIYAEEFARYREINSRGLGLGLVYFGFENWEFGLSHDSYKYSLNPRLLSSRIALEILSSKALTISSGLKDYSNNIDVTYLLANTDITVSYGQSKSAIDGTMSDVASIGINFYQLYPVQIGVEIGSVDASSDDASSYAGFNLGYLW